MRPLSWKIGAGPDRQLIVARLPVRGQLSLPMWSGLTLGTHASSSVLLIGLLPWKACDELE